MTNPCILEPVVKIPIGGGNGGFFALVDATDAPELMKHNWTVRYARKNDSPYARRNVILPNGKQRTIFMHREIMKTEHGFMIDHINGNTLDNRRANLRIATDSQNKFNRARQISSASSYKGIVKQRDCNRWAAFIKFGQRHLYLGLHKTPEDAAIAYDMAALMYHGEFAKTNILIPKQ